MLIARLQAVYEADISNFERGTAKVQAGVRSAESAISKGVGSSDKLSTPLRGLGGALGGVGSSSGKASSAISSFAGNLAASGVLLTTAAVTSGAKSLLDYSAKMEQTKIGFATLMGGAAQATAHIAELQKFANETPFEFAGLADASRRFQNVGLDAKKVIPIMQSVGDAVAAAGGSSETLDRVTVAISQIAAKGKVSAEEINQLAESGVGGWRILSEQLGRSTADVMKLAEQGKISSDVFIQAFQNFSAQHYGDAMKKQSNTFSGAMSTISDSVMIAASTAFAPMFERISSLAVDMSNEIQANGNDLEAVGDIIAKYIAKGIGSLGKYAYDSFITDLQAFFAGKKDIFTPMEFGADIAAAWNGTSKVVQKSIADIRMAEGAIKGVATSTKNVPSLSKQLDAADAAEKAKKVYETLRGVIGDLGRQIMFFGDESKVAATKQALMRDGITDFNSGLAKTAINFASYIDKLTAGKKVQDEFNEKVKKGREYLTELREQTQFKIKFGEGTELEKFTDWVSKNTKGMAMLKAEIVLTQQELERFKNQQVSSDRLKNFAEFSQSGMSEIIKGIGQATDRTQPLENKLLDVAKAMHLVRTEIMAVGKQGGVDITDTTFAQKTSEFLTQIKEQTARFNAAFDNLGEKGYDNFGELFDKARIKNQADLDAITTSFTDFLGTLKMLDSKGERIDVFKGTTLMKPFIDQLVYLDSVVNQKTLSDGLEKLDGIFTDLKIRVGDVGLLTSLEKVNNLLSAPDVTAAIEERAKALGYTSQQLTETIRLAATSTAGAEGATRPRIAEMPPPQMSPWDAFFANLHTKFEAFKTTLPSIKDQLTETFINLPSRIGDVFTNAVAQWDGTFSGFFKSLAKGFGELVKQLLIEALKMLVINTLMKAFGGGFGGGPKPTFGLLNTTTGAVAGIPPRATGGQVKSGSPYIVGEKGWEMFVPKTDGTIVNQKQLGSGAAAPVVNVYNNFHADPQTGAFSKPSAEQAAIAAASHIERAARRNR